MGYRLRINAASDRANPLARYHGTHAVERTTRVIRLSRVFGFGLPPFPINGNAHIAGIRLHAWSVSRVRPIRRSGLSRETSQPASFQTRSRPPLTRRSAT